MNQKTINGGSTGASTPTVTIVNNDTKKDDKEKKETKE
jgi:hypothetical protein